MIRVLLASLLGLQGARFVYAPGTPPDLVACVEACAAGCGLTEGSPADPADVACLRRALAGAPVSCP